MSQSTYDGRHHLSGTIRRDRTNNDIHLENSISARTNLEIKLDKVFRDKETYHSFYKK